jgi:hypothetical protein
MSGLNSMQVVTNYDSAGRLTTWLLLKGDKEIQKIVYDKEENFQTTYANGKPKLQVSVTYNPHIKRTIYFTPNGEIETNIEETYETQYITSHSKGKDPKASWDYTYKNIFGKNGRISRREVRVGKKIFQTILYQYNTKGLLEMKSTLSDLHPPIIENFVYTYYK